MSLDLMSSISKNVFTVPINTAIQPTLTDTFADYLVQLVKNDLASLRTLAKLTASTFSYKQPLKHIVLTEGNQTVQFNLFLFLNGISPVDIQVGALNDIVKPKNTLEYLRESHNNPIQPFIMMTDGTNISKSIGQNRSQLKRLISGANIAFDDEYLSKIQLNNNVPIIFSTESMRDYHYLCHFYHMCMNCYSDDLLIYELSAEEREWITQIFIPWGKEILCNANLDITKKQKKNKTNLPQNSIENFLSLFVRKKEQSHIYPEDLYASYLKYLASKDRDTSPIEKAPFIKFVKKLDGYEYGRYHIRETSSHEGSNRYAFKNMELDELSLKNYIEKSESPLQNTYNLKDDLEIITSHYQNLFDSVVSPNINEKIKLQHNPSAKIVRKPKNEQPKKIEFLQKVTKTIEQ